MPTKWFLMVAVAVVIGFASVAMTAPAPRPPRVSPSPSPPQPRPVGREAPEPRTGFPLPRVVVKDLDGRDVDLASYRGKVLVLHLFASWCDPCKEEMPELAKLAARITASDCVVLGVGTESVAALRATAAQYGLSYPILRDVGRPLRTALGADTIPRTVIIDRGGTVRVHLRGYHGSMQPVIDALRNLGVPL